VIANLSHVAWSARYGSSIRNGSDARSYSSANAVVILIFRYGDGCVAAGGRRLADRKRLAAATNSFAIRSRMDVERIIDDIEQLQEMFEAPDIRPLSATDISAANRRHDEMLAHSPWFKLWQHYGVCCRSESPVIQLPE
jgi:hypothetical protein